MIRNRRRTCSCLGLNSAISNSTPTNPGLPGGAPSRQPRVVELRVVSGGVTSDQSPRARERYKMALPQSAPWTASLSVAMAIALIAPSRAFFPQPAAPSSSCCSRTQRRWAQQTSTITGDDAVSCVSCFCRCCRCPTCCCGSSRVMLPKCHSSLALQCSEYTSSLCDKRSLFRKYVCVLPPRRRDLHRTLSLLLRSIIRSTSTFYPFILSITWISCCVSHTLPSVMCTHALRRAHARPHKGHHNILPLTYCRIRQR